MTFRCLPLFVTICALWFAGVVVRNAAAQPVLKHEGFFRFDNEDKNLRIGLVRGCKIGLHPDGDKLIVIYNIGADTKVGHCDIPKRLEQPVPPGEEPNRPVRSFWSAPETHWSATQHWLKHEFLPTKAEFQKERVGASRPPEVLQQLARVSGFVVRKNRIIINFAQYYHTQPIKYRHLQAYELDGTPLGPALGPANFPRESTRSVQGAISLTPNGFIVGNSWISHNGPWMTLLVPTAGNPSYRWRELADGRKASYSSCEDDYYSGVVIGKWFVFSGRIGTPTGWYGKFDGTGILPGKSGPGPNNLVPNPFSKSKGFHASPYRARIFCVPLATLLTGDPQAIMPHFEKSQDVTESLLASVVVDGKRYWRSDIDGLIQLADGRLAMLERAADSTKPGFTARPVVHVFSAVLP